MSTSRRALPVLGEPRWAAILSASRAFLARCRSRRRSRHSRSVAATVESSGSTVGLGTTVRLERRVSKRSGTQCQQPLPSAPCASLASHHWRALDDGGLGLMPRSESQRRLRPGKLGNASRIASSSSRSKCPSQGVGAPPPLFRAGERPGGGPRRLGTHSGGSDRSGHRTAPKRVGEHIDLWCRSTTNSRQVVEGSYLLQGARGRLPTDQVPAGRYCATPSAFPADQARRLRNGAPRGRIRFLRDSNPRPSARRVATRPKALLQRPGGFEGFVRCSVAAVAGDLAAPNGDHPCHRGIAL